MKITRDEVALGLTGKATLQGLPSGTLRLKISSLPDVNVPPGCTLLIENDLANGLARIIVVEDFIRFSGVSRVNNKLGIMDLTNQ